MASDIAIAKRIESALNTLVILMDSVADATGVSPVAIPRHARGGSRMLEALQLEAMVNWMSDLVTALSPSPLADDPSDTSVEVTSKAKRGRPAKATKP